MKIDIPVYLEFLREKFVSVDSLVRFGGFRDGGYVLPSKAVLFSEILVSGGVGSNARFERDCLDYNSNLDVFLIDKSTSSLRMLLRVFYHFFKHGSIFAYISLMEFFSYKSMIKNSTLIQRFLNKEYDINNLFSDYDLKKNNVLLKLDIEGSEYEILNSILTNEDNITALVIEFHDIDIQDNIDRIKHFVFSTSLQLVYISINETSIESDKYFPKIIELTFSRFHDSKIDDRFLQSHCFPSKDCETIYFSLINH